MEAINVSQENGLTFKATELRLGLPGTDESVMKMNHKRRLPNEESGVNGDSDDKHSNHEAPPAAK